MHGHFKLHNIVMLQRETILNQGNIKKNIYFYENEWCIVGFFLLINESFTYPPIMKVTISYV